MASVDPASLYHYKLSTSKQGAVKKYLQVSNSGGPYYRHLHRLAHAFVEAHQRVVPINWFWWRMTLILNPDAARKRGYTTGAEIYQVCRQRGWGNETNKFPQQDKTGIMTDFRLMSEAAYKMCNPETWPLMEVTDEGDTGQIAFLLIPTLLAMDTLLMDANQAAGGGRMAVPTSHMEESAVGAQMRTQGLKTFYVNFRKNFAIIMGNTVSQQVWQEAIGWDDPHGYHIGKLMASLQPGSKLRRALTMIPDSVECRQAVWLMFVRACPFLKNTPAASNLHFPPFPVMRNGQRVRMGGMRNETGQLLIKDAYKTYQYMWKFAEEQLPVQPVYDKWVWFYDPGRFARVVVALNAFLTYALKLANGAGTYLGLQHERTRRTWGLVVARRLTFLVDELGILDENVCGRADPFFMLALNRTSNNVETAYDPKQFAQRYSKLAELARRVADTDQALVLDGIAGPIDWAHPSEAEAMFKTVEGWISKLQRERPAVGMFKENRDQFWAQQARELSGDALAGPHTGRPVVMPSLDILQSVHDSPAPAAEKRPRPDEAGVQMDNTPLDKRRRVDADPSVQPPNNVHSHQAMDGVGVPALEKVNDPSRGPSLASGMAAGGPGRDRSREASLAGAGFMQGADNMHDGDESMGEDDPIILDDVSGAGDQGSRPGRSRTRSEKRGRGEFMWTDPGGTRKRSRSRARSAPVTRSTPVVIASHPQAASANLDVPAMVAQVIAREIKDGKGWKDPDAVARQVKELMGQLGQPQQEQQRFHSVVAPKDMGQAGIEASGFFLFASHFDQRLYGIVRSWKAPMTDEPGTFLVQIVGGSNDGSFQRVSLDDGVYKPAGPFPVLALANPSVPHGKIPLNEMNRLKDQRLAVTTEVLTQMTRGEMRYRAEGGGAPYSSIAGDGLTEPPSEEQIQSYAAELATRWGPGQIAWRDSSTESLWIDLGCAKKWGQVATHHYAILRTLKNYVQQMQSGRAAPVVVQESGRDVTGAAAPDVDPHGVPPADYLNYLSGWDNTSLAVLASILIVVLLMIFSD